MLSHSWAEDMEEAQDALNQLLRPNGGAMPRGMWISALQDPSCIATYTEDTRVWFCIFANYQCEDGAGPTISEQLKLDPFGSVIASPHVEKMIVLHTSTAEVILTSKPEEPVSYTYTYG